MRWASETVSNVYVIHSGFKVFTSNPSLEKLLAGLYIFY